MKTTARIADQITTAYTAVITAKGKRHGDWIKLADLRDELGESVNRWALDDALIEMCRNRTAILIPETIQQHLSQADRDSAVEMGNQMKHLVRLG